MSDDSRKEGQEPQEPDQDVTKDMGNQPVKPSQPSLVPPRQDFSDPEKKTSPVPSDSLPVQPGEIGRDVNLGDRYLLEEMIGEGGMGMVYRATDLELEETIAIKVLQRQFTQSPDDVRRFKREIKTARKITHLNVIRIHDFGVADREAFISMELLPGGTLAQKQDAEGIPDHLEAIQISTEIADGLAAAHRQGVIHRDIKPHNVLFDEHGTVKLVDFGIARFAASTMHTAGMMGTPHYMSPEQADGVEVNEQSDVYSLGVLMYELFTGELPFDASSVAKLAVMHVHETPPPPRSIRPDLDENIERIILRCLEKDKRNRYADGAAIARALREYKSQTISETVTEDHAPPQPKIIGGARSKKHDTVPEVDDQQLMRTTAPPRDLVPRTPAQRRRRFLIISLVVLGVIAVAGTFLGPLRLGVLLSGRDAETPMPSASATTPPLASPSAATTAVGGSGAPGLDRGTATPQPKTAEATRTRVVANRTRTPRRTPRRTPAPTATPVPKPGKINLSIKPWGYVEIDGVMVLKNGQKAEIRTLNGYRLSAGVHKITIQSAPTIACPRLQTTFRIEPGKTLDQIYDLRTYQPGCPPPVAN